MKLAQQRTPEPAASASGEEHETERTLAVARFSSRCHFPARSSLTPSSLVSELRQAPHSRSSQWHRSSRLFFNGYQGESEAQRHILPSPTRNHRSLFFTKAAEIAVVGLQVSTLRWLSAIPTIAFRHPERRRL